MRVRTMADAGALVRGAREDAGWTQAELATRARVSREWLVAFENGKPNANLRLVLAVLEVLGLVTDIVPDPVPRVSTRLSRADELAGAAATTTETHR